MSDGGATSPDGGVSAKPGAETPPEDAPLHLFEATGVELEYMIVDRESLSVRPLADRVLGAVGGTGEVEVELGPMAWSNELALHVVEIKTNGPVAELSGAAERFLDSVRRIDAILESHGARLMPTGMHPWMDPEDELHLWPHEAGPIYRTFHRIFDCTGHGWANLQSMHVNLPFCGDEELGRLHAAIRMLLPVLPGLAASSPFADGRATGYLDSRMEYYRHNADRVPSVAGAIVPERVYSRQEYEDRILGRIYREMEGLDPDGILRHEWVNARGAIARFDRGAIEIRVIDLQETPRADLAVCALTVAAVRAVAEGRLGDPDGIRDWPEERLAEIFRRCLVSGDRTRIAEEDYVRALDLPADVATAGELWRAVRERVGELPPEAEEPLAVILERGCLARRILEATGPEPDRGRLHEVYRELSDCLVQDRVFCS